MQIFISYRRSDSAEISRLIDHGLRERYGHDSAFRDVTEIKPGAEFPEEIRKALERADIFLSLIGPDWVRKGAFSETDYVRLEIEAAFENRLEVLPILVVGGTMPPVSDLPESMQLVAKINALHIDSGSDFDAHMNGLFQVIEDGEDTRVQLGEQHRIVRDARRAAFALGEDGWNFSADVSGDQYVFLLTLKRFLESTNDLFRIQLKLARNLVRGIKTGRRGLDDGIRAAADQIPEERYWLRRRLRNETDHMRRVHGAILGLLSRNREVFSLVPDLQELYDHLSIWVAKYERFRHDDSMCLIFVGPEQNMAFPKNVERDIRKAVDELDERLKFQ